MSFLDKVFGDPGDKHIKKKLQPIVEKINKLEPRFEAMQDEELKAQTQRFKDELQQGKTLEDILPEAFACVREASKRTMGMRHFDVQLIGGMVLNQGSIAEMRTGEGKTLVGTLPVYLNALTGKGVHVVTVNDYLARRDAVWMAQVYSYLGLSVGCIQHEKSYLYDSGARVGEKDTEDEKTGEGEGLIVDASPVVEIDYDQLRTVTRKEAYAADITYGTNNEFGFDYLRDNMVVELDQMVQREFAFAIVDEVDSILIDEARTPLIISAPDNRPVDLYYKYAELVVRLKENEDFNVDEKMRASSLTDEGMKKMEEWLGIENIYTESGVAGVHHIEQALKAHALFQKDKDYVVQNNEVVIVDEFTGRLMQGRRYSEGLHQAIEAKEKVEIKRESRTLATITFQNYFRLYPKLSGMTGTAKTEEEEFRRIYGLDVYVVPTNKPIQRVDAPDKIYKSKSGKYQALAKEIKQRSEQGQPVLVGTVSIEQNEEFSKYLHDNNVTHEILNAKNHEREAEIIAQAGKAGAITLATNMAGRGVDIALGGTPHSAEEAQKVKDAGGLHVIGTERHESRRIDNQLRGRAGRQGDPGSSVFYISVDDDLMRIFGSDRIRSLMTKLGLPEDMPIENRMVSKSIESAQKKVEGNNFDIRKHVVEYDDVTNRHREAIYRKRKEILATKTLESIEEELFEMVDQEITQVVNFHTAATNHQDWNLTEIEQTMATIFPTDTAFDLPAVIGINTESRDKGDDAKMRSKLIDHLTERAHDMFDKMTQALPDEEQVVGAIRGTLLNSVDTLWMDHLESLDNLRTAVGLRGYGQKDPLVEYKRDAYGLFKQLQGSIQNQVVYSVFKILAARVMQLQQAGDDTGKATEVLGAFNKGLSALKGLKFSAPAKEMSARSESPMTQSASMPSTRLPGGAVAHSTPAENRNRFDGAKVGRNDVCPCGSGKKYKKCHGKG